MGARRRTRARKAIGLIPRVGQGLWAGGRWLVRHPQPAFLLGVFFLVGWAVSAYVQRAEAFKVARIVLPEGSTLQVRKTGLGMNIWSVNLRAIADDLQRQQPSLKEVHVVRELPNTIRIQPVRRVPVAQVRMDRWYPVDLDGFVLPEGEAAPAEHLIRIAGADRDGPLRIGKAHASARLDLALRVLTTLRRAPAAVSRRLTEIDVSDPQQIRFRLDDATEIRCGSETELATHLQRLHAALRALARQPISAQYIDVRFREPVVAPRGS